MLFQRQLQANERERKGISTSRSDIAQPAHDDDEYHAD